jgi:N-acyl-D-amino-acid deacylase
VHPDALFRIASVSKPNTGVAVMKLVEEGKLGIDDRVAPLIAPHARAGSDRRPAAGASPSGTC